MENKMFKGPDAGMGGGATESNELNKLNEELENELTIFKTHTEKEIKSGLGYILWLTTFNQKMDSITQRIQKIKGIKPSFILSSENKEKIKQLNLLKEKVESVHTDVHQSSTIASEGLLDDKMKQPE